MELIFDNRRLIEAFTKAPRLLVTHLDLAIDRSVRAMARDARKGAAKAFSTLTQSIGSRLPSPLTGEFFAGVDYARAVEEGTDSGGYPPRQTLLDWIRVHRIEPRDPDMDEEDLAYVIGRFIAIRGTPAQPYMAPAFEGNKRRAERGVSRAIDETLRRMSNL